MLARLMRHPAGLMRKAWGKRLLADAFRHAAPATRPDYWTHRYAAPGIALVTPPAPAPAPAAPGARAAAPWSLAYAQGGKAGSCLRPAAAAAPASAPGARAEGSRAARP